MTSVTPTWTIKSVEEASAVGKAYCLRYSITTA